MAETSNTQEAPGGKRIIFTGGSGKVGRHIIDGLLQCGHQLLNLDLVPLPNPAVHTIKTDLTHSGQVFSALTSPFRLTEPFHEPLLQPPDAVLHFAGMARNMIVPDDETFRINATSAFNVLEAACKLGVKKIIIASSVTTYGVTYAQGDVDYPSFPIDESMHVEPMDTYAMSKVCAEVVACGYARRFGVDVYVLRLGAVVVPDDFDAVFQEYVNNPGAWKVHGWSYIDVRDLSQMCNLCVLKDGLGFQVFNATNDEITAAIPTAELLRRECPKTPFTRKMGKWEAPISNRKIKEMLGFEEKHDWRAVYKVEK